MENVEEPRRKSWWGRNWIWVVPLGCLGFLVVVLGGLFLLMTLIFGVIKSSDVYKTALIEARQSSVLLQAIGEPMEPGMFVTGNINVSGPSGEANLAIPVSGPMGKATVYVVAEKTAGQWQFLRLEAELKSTGERLALGS